MSVTIVPSYPAPDQAKLESFIGKIGKVSGAIQIDLVDGKYVPPVSWPFTEEDPVAALTALSNYSNELEVSVDCMIQNPEQYINLFLKSGVSRIVIHYGSTEFWKEISAVVHKEGKKIGLAITNDVLLEDIEQMLPEADYIQVMGIATVGKQGQPFDERTVDTIKSLHKKYPSLVIAVDGSVNEATIPALVAAGATRLAPGSVLTKEPDPVSVYKQLVTLANA